MEVRVKSPFVMGGHRYVEGDKINIDPEKAKSLAYSGLVAGTTVQEAKVMDRPTKDKMVKSPVKKKSKRRKR